MGPVELCLLAHGLAARLGIQQQGSGGSNCHSPAAKFLNPGEPAELDTVVLCAILGI